MFRCNQWSLASPGPALGRARKGCSINKISPITRPSPGAKPCQRGAALIPTDCEALAYHAAVFSDTARVAGLAFLRFLDWAWRPDVLDLLTQAPLALPPRAGPFSRVFPGRPGTYLPRLAGGCEGPLRIGARRNLWMEIGKLNNLTLGKANASADAALTAARDRGIRFPRPEPAFTVNRFGCERVNASDRRENIKEVHDALEMGGGRHSWRRPGCHARFGTE